MSLVEIARYTDVHEADLAAAFLESHGIRIFVTERYQTTIDPLMQRALGIRLMGCASNLVDARALLARVQAGEFAEVDDEDRVEPTRARTRAATTVMALAAFAFEGFWGTSLPRRFLPIAWQGMALAVAALLLGLAVIATVRALILDPP